MALDLTTIPARPPAQLDDCLLLAHALDWSPPTAATLLARFGGIHGLVRTPFDELERARVPHRRALQLHAALELGRRSIAEPLRRHSLTTPAQVVDAMRPRLAALEQEQLVVVGFDTRQRLLVDFIVAVGSGVEVACAPADLLRPLILAAAQSFIVVHNHPSGAIKPSERDRALTRQLGAAGALVGIDLVDHIIVGREGTYSFAAERPR